MENPKFAKVSIKQPGPSQKKWIVMVYLRAATANFWALHSVSEHKKRYIRNYTQILENLRNTIVGFFGLRNEFENVQGNKKRNTQNIQVKKQKNAHLNFSAL